MYAHFISHIYMYDMYVRIYIIYVVCNAFGCRLCILLPGFSTSFHDLQHNRWVVSFVSHPLGTTGEHGYDSASTWEWSPWGTVLVLTDQLEEVELTRKRCLHSTFLASFDTGWFSHIKTCRLLHCMDTVSICWKQRHSSSRYFSCF